MLYFQVSNNNNKVPDAKPPAQKKSHTLNRYRGESDIESVSDFGIKSPRKTLDFANFSLMSERSDTVKVDRKTGDEELDTERVGRNQNGIESNGIDSQQRELKLSPEELLKLINEAGITDEPTIVALLKDQLGIEDYPRGSNILTNNYQSAQVTEQGYNHATAGVNTTQNQQFSNSAIHNPSSNNTEQLHLSSNQRTHSLPVSSSTQNERLQKTFPPTQNAQLQRSAMDMMHNGGYSTMPSYQNGDYRQQEYDQNGQTIAASQPSSMNSDSHGTLPHNTHGRLLSDTHSSQSQHSLPNRFTAVGSGTYGYTGYIEEDDVMIVEENDHNYDNGYHREEEGR